MEPKFTIGMTADFLDAQGNFPARDMGTGMLDATGGQVAFKMLAEDRGELGPDQLRELDGVIVGAPKVSAASLAGAERLKIVARFGVGFDNVDIPACTAADVALTITAGAVSTPVAEGVVCLMLSVTHQLLNKDRLVRFGQWGEKGRYTGSEIRDRIPGIVGLGRIGRRTLELLSGFGMKPAIATDPNVDEATMAALGVKKVDLPTLLRTADFVIVTCSLNETSRGMIGAEQLALMKPDAYLFNTARGPIVQQEPLAEVLRERRIAGAGLDVFEVEPADTSLPFVELDNVVLTPHAICLTHEAYRDMGRMAFNSILDVFRGTMPEGILNEEVWERPGFQRKLADKLA